MTFRTVLASFAGVAVAMLTPAAQAHFHLNAPAASLVQDGQGNPQKVGPCGSPTGTATGQVTAYRPGQVVEISVNETIYHPGHYRVALAVNDLSELPPDPEVKEGPVYGCGTAAIEKSPKLPLLGDGLLQHSAAFQGPQTMRVQLPTNVSCTKCTLQIIEFMSEHEPNCFYYHCANISIQGDPVDAGPDAGISPNGDGGTSGGGGDGGGGGGGHDHGDEDDGLTQNDSGCSLPPGGTPAAGGFAGMFAVSFFACLLRRRKASRRLTR